MGKKMMMSALVGVLLGGTIPAFAQDHGYRDAREQGMQQRDRDYRQDDRYQRDRDSRDYRDYRQQDRYQRERDDRDRYQRSYDRMHGGWGRTADYDAGYEGGGPNHDMRRGQRLPSRYRTHQYVVDNWRAHRLSAPPRGYHWVQAGSDYLLVAVATGLIADMIVNH